MKSLKLITLAIIMALSTTPIHAVTWQQDLTEIYTAPIILEPVQSLPWLALLGVALANDQAVRDYALGNKSAAGGGFFTAVTNLGHPNIDLAIAGGLALTGEDEVAYKAANAIAYAGIATQTVKIIAGRPRPYLGDRASEPLAWDDDYWSFPSGHTASAFALARVLADEYPDYKALFYGGAVLVGVSRIYLNEHYASDVIAGAAIGLYAGGHVEANSHLFEVRF